MPSSLPAGTVTLLFSDIEDSTRLWEKAPAEMASALEIHDRLVRGTIEQHGGYVFAPEVLPRWCPGSTTCA